MKIYKKKLKITTLTSTKNYMKKYLGNILC